MVGCGTLHAAPPLIIDLTKMPRSAWFSLERFPLTLTPNPAEPESLSGISKVRNSLVPSGVRTNSSSSVFCKRGNKNREGSDSREKIKTRISYKHASGDTKQRHALIAAFGDGGVQSFTGSCGLARGPKLEGRSLDYLRLMKSTGM